MLEFIGMILLSLMITVMFMIVYIKTLSVFTNWLERHYGKQIKHLLRKFFPNIGNQRGNARQDSKIEIGCIYCFDKTYKCLHQITNHFKRWFRISGIFQGIINKSAIDTQRYYRNDQSRDKYSDRNVKDSLYHNHLKKGG